MIFVSIVEDDSVIRNNLADLINSIEGYKCIGSYSGCESLINEIEDNLPDVILMDIDLPGISGIEGIKKIKKLKPAVDIIAVTVHENDDIVFDMRIKKRILQHRGLIPILFINADYISILLILLGEREKR